MTEKQAELSPNVTVRRWWAILAIAAAFVHGAVMSWGKWGELLIDTGMDLEDARMLQEKGRMLYVNPLYPYGPLIPYFNALLFRVFGVNSWVLCGAGLCCAALMCWVLYRMARLFVNRLGAAAAVIAFIYCCAFAQLLPNGLFNFVLSYRSCAQDGALFAAAGTFFLLRHTLKSKPRDFVLSLFFLALAGLSKIEAGVAAVAPHLAFIVGQIWTRRFNVRLYLCGYAGALVAIVGVYGFFYAQAGRSLFDDNLLQMAQHENYKLYARKNMGLFDLNESFTKLATSIFLFAIVCGPVVALARLLKPNVIATRADNARMGGVCAFLALVAYFIPKLTDSLDVSFRFVPFLGLGLLVALTLASFGSMERRVAALPQAILWTFVLGSLSRMFLRTISNHYGFYLLPPAFVGLAVFFFKFLPACFPGVPRVRIFAACACLGMLGGQIVNHIARSTAMYAERTEGIETPRGSITVRGLDEFIKRGGQHVNFPTGEYWHEVVNFLLKLPRDARVLIVPHGQSGLTFFAGLEDPYKDYVTAAPTLHGRFDDDEFLEKVKAEPPDYIIKSRLDVSEYGQTAFGESYSRKTWTYLQPRYEVAQTFGPDYIEILKRKP